MRDVAQIGAALGRSFSYELISSVAEMPQQNLDEALDQLISAELIFQRGTPPDAEYTFKHAPVREAAYSTLLRSRRQHIHARITKLLEREFSDLSITQPETLAHHCAEGGLLGEAIEYYLAAAKRATAASSNTEAARHLTKGFALLKMLPASARRTELVHQLQRAGWWGMT
jgi:predicted ATPase